MKKTIIKVPYGIKYISEWENYKLPKGHCIVDKGVTGCGYTEYCLRNDKNVILCSPRKLLLENKSEQHKKKGDVNIFYLENDLKEGEKNFEGEKDLKQRLRNHILFCQGTPFTPSYPIKILVTYDSVHYVIDVLKEYEMLDQFHFIIDEFQSIFLDAFFKASTEFNFVEYLQECPNVLYLSATPQTEKYLMLVDEFKDLDYYELDWSETGLVETVKITRKKFYDSICSSCNKIIQNYKNGKYPTSIDLKGNPVQSKEVVFYINSVNDIIKTIKKANLKPWEVNIICSRDDKNKKKLKDLSKEILDETEGEFKIGKVPLEDEPNKMFTFCTRSVYIGADFYSKCASTYVYADPNIKSLALDITLDLPQIVGRQRDRENPFKNEVTLFYRTTHKIQTREEFEKEQQLRQEETKNLLDLYNNATSSQRNSYLQKLRRDSEIYMHDFVGISSKTGLPVHNKFIELSYERAWEVSQKDYQDSINVTKTIDSIDILESYSQGEKDTELLEKFKFEFDSSNIFAKKLEVYCKYMDFSSGNSYLQDLLSGYTSYVNYRKYYDFYGTKGCKANKYQEADLERGIITKSILYSEKDLILREFQIGESYTKAYVRDKFTKIYSTLGINKNPNAKKDLEGYFNIERARIKNSETKKYDEGYKIISKK